MPPWPRPASTASRCATNSTRPSAPPSVTPSVRPTEPGPRPEPAAAGEAEPEASENPVTSFISPSSTIAGFTFGQTRPREG